ncbi:MAG TPA: magnesium/cobalt transporter CorA [Candidatus Omnitrophota bacterium]|nr:magnesium/cobalt transporter CorA [Candidatus Omnitrophota bacterium]HQO58722.1 magnesium/cobalt transporter CorA [Candidatus Omnitrophota bacterium]
MRRSLNKKSKNIGLPPGTIVANGAVPGDVEITLIDYSPHHCQEKQVRNVEECFPFKASPSITWINLEGMDPFLIQSLNEHFQIHPLVSEDIVHSGQRPKMEVHDQYIFIVLKMIYFQGGTADIVDEQVSLLLGPGYVISFQEKPGDVFDLIRTRIREGKGRIRGQGADYLAYCLLDAIVDNYFLILEKREEALENLEDAILDESGPDILQDMHQFKKEIIYLKKQVWPLREVISGLQRNESSLVTASTQVYLRDLYDHTIQVIESIESFRDMIIGMHDIYLSRISNRLNEIMKVLTMFSAIFIPLTFVAGVYGMNFQYMPALNWRWGYVGVLGLMAGMAVGMIIYFKNKKWL